MPYQHHLPHHFHQALSISIIHPTTSTKPYLSASSIPPLPPSPIYQHHPSLFHQALSAPIPLPSSPPHSTLPLPPTAPGSAESGASTGAGWRRSRGRRWRGCWGSGGILHTLGRRRTGPDGGSSRTAGGPHTGGSPACSATGWRRAAWSLSWSPPASSW